MAWSNNTKALIDLRDEDARTVRLRQDTLCSNGGCEAWFDTLQLPKLRCLRQQPKVCVLVFIVLTSGTL